MMDAEQKQQANRVLAEVLGWRDIEEDEWWEETRDSGPYLCKALMGTSPSGDKERLLPDWCGSVDAVLAVLKGERVSLWIDFETGTVMLRDYATPDGRDAYEYLNAVEADTVEWGVASALLQWAQAQHADAATGE